MRIHVELEDGLLPDRFGKYAPAKDTVQHHPVRSFPIEIEGVPENAASLALTFLDWDAVPVGVFCWIHWTTCDIDPTCSLIPEDASRTGAVAMTQGKNSDWSPLAGSIDDKRIVERYAGPCPPDKTHSYTLTVYALDTKLGLKTGFYANELRHAMAGHVLDSASLELPSRA